jgi:hypothetical protein
VSGSLARWPTPASLIAAASRSTATLAIDLSEPGQEVDTTLRETMLGVADGIKEFVQEFSENAALTINPPPGICQAAHDAER